MNRSYKKPFMEFYQFETEDVMSASGEVIVPTGTTKPLTDVVTPDPWEDE